MTNTYLPDDFEQQMNQAIEQQIEGPKLDFKRQMSTKLSGNDLAEFIKDTCAIANTDDPDHFGDAGLILIGVTRDGQFHPLGEDFDSDKLSATLNDQLKTYVAPPLNLRVAGPFTHPRGKYAVIVIPPSRQQPHMPVRAVGPVHPGQWWVRQGDSTAPAGPADYARVLGKHVDRVAAPLRAEIERHHGQMTNLEQRLERLQASVLQQAGQPVADAPDLSLAAKIRHGYAPPHLPLRQALHRDLLTFLEAFEGAFSTQEEESRLRDPAARCAKLLELETLTAPLAEGLGAAVLYGAGELDGDAGDILREVTRLTLTFPRYGSLSTWVEHFRTYPQVLLVFTVMAAAIQAGRIAWLPPVLRSTERHFLAQHAETMLMPTRRLSEWEEVFRHPDFGIQDTCAPGYQRLIDVTVGRTGWLSQDLPITYAPTLGATTELLQSLILHGEPNDHENLTSSPIPNTLVYRLDGSRLLREAQRLHGDLLLTVMPGASVPARLRRYISAVQGYHKPNQPGCRNRLSMNDILP